MNRIFIKDFSQHNQDAKLFYKKMLSFSKKFNIFCLLDSQHFQDKYSQFEWTMALGVHQEIFLNAKNGFSTLNVFYEKNLDWLFGHLGFDLQEETENIVQSKNTFIDFGAGYFFTPKILLRKFFDGRLIIETKDTNAENVFNAINNENENIDCQQKKIGRVEKQIDRSFYLNQLEKVLAHIQRGDCYELNFCQTFSAKGTIDPYHFWEEMCIFSPAPFSAFYRLKDKWCISASPERFIQKQNDDLLAQPMKGTIRRDLNNIEKDHQLKIELKNSKKDRTENVMIVDLMRNDLSKTAKRNSVEVEELFGVYSFPKVHQMISTIKAKMSNNFSAIDVLKSCFPMGSMTGAPKKRVLEITAELESFNRNLYSGSIGYLSPDGNFDFNVVIRSLFYDAENELLNFSAGGGITANSNPDAEYEESILKAKFIEELIQKT